MKPIITVFAMGGTIAMSGQGDRGVKPSLDATMLVDAVPQLADIALVKAKTFRQLPSPEITIPDLLELCAAIDRAVADGAAGTVVTQGTDTMEETAFVLDRLLTGNSPVVITGAMRNPTMAGADGPANLLNAVRLAAHKKARGLGTLVTMNDQIHAARYVQKGHTSSTNAFRSVPAGPIGWFAEGVPRLVGPPRRRFTLGTPEGAEIPPVALLTATLGDDGSLVDQALRAGYRGIVIEATGGGHTAGWLADRLAVAAEKVPVIFATRTSAGEILRQTYDFRGSETDLLARGLVSAGWLDGLKARLLLILLLMNGADTNKIRETFTMWLDPTPG